MTQLPAVHLNSYRLLSVPGFNSNYVVIIIAIPPILLNQIRPKINLRWWLWLVKWNLIQTQQFHFKTPWLSILHIPFWASSYSIAKLKRNIKEDTEYQVFISRYENIKIFRYRAWISTIYGLQMSSEVSCRKG